MDSIHNVQKSFLEGITSLPGAVFIDYLSLRVPTAECFGNRTLKAGAVEEEIAFFQELSTTPIENLFFTPAFFYRFDRHTGWLRKDSKFIRHQIRPRRLGRNRNGSSKRIHSDQGINLAVNRAANEKRLCSLRNSFYERIRKNNSLDRHDLSQGFGGVGLVTQNLKSNVLSPRESYSQELFEMLAYAILTSRFYRGVFVVSGETTAIDISQRIYSLANRSLKLGLPIIPKNLVTLVRNDNPSKFSSFDFSSGRSYCDVDLSGYAVRDSEQHVSNL